ncbi:GAF domain-containing protein [Nocardioides panacisoli]|uniref:GAF domain-containing protein n=1 Tax=Nocardioides panacisoli TaxID=627624 RepID=UPI001C63AA41|nr:GAF domain-containing protein [Nocardioides panacisoli]QYJ05237.1 GAF domain-containing protein [Nocardioides panacisoli]
MATSPDLAALARDLVRIHDAVLTGATPPQQPRALVARSWSRMLDLGLDPSARNDRNPLTPAELEARRRRSRLSLVIEELRLVLASAADASRYLVVVTDADGVVLWRDGSAAVRRHADRLGFAEGATWTEGTVGTNAIGTALAEAAPVQLFSAEHFESAQHPWYCTAAPVHDPADGSLLGVVDVSGPALSLHPTVRALVTTAVRLAEAQLWRRHEERLDDLRRAAAPLLGGANGPLLVVDDHGWVAAEHGVSGRDRIEAPQAERTVAVPGLGLCVPERLHGGWLIRPSAPQQLTARLERGAGQATLVIHHGEEPWVRTLTPRHADILTLLVAVGPSGATAADLSRSLFGDGDHEVSVRAEISRMRRTLGALVATNPYRIRDGVEVSVVTSAE